MTPSRFTPPLLALCLWPLSACPGTEEIFVEPSRPFPPDTLPSFDTAGDVDTFSPTDASPTDSLIFEGPRRLLPGRPGLIGVRKDRKSGPVTLGAVEALLHHGRGVLRIEPDARATDAGPDRRSVIPFDPSDPRDLRITEDLHVKAGDTLVWPAGARVMIAPDVDIVIEGRLDALGTPDDPILVTSATSEPWKTLEIRGEANLSHVWLTAGGAGTPTYEGHSDSNPVLAILGGRLLMTGGAIADNPGKSILGKDADITLSDVLIARCDTGGEFIDSTVKINDTHIIQIPDADRLYDDDDNDGLYLRTSQVEIKNTVISLTEDDGLDHNGSDLAISGSIIEDVRHEGLACSDSGTVSLEDSLIRNAAHAVEAGYGGPNVTVSRSVLMNCPVGVRWGDEYEWESRGTLTVTHNIFFGVQTPILSVDPQQGEAPEGAISGTCNEEGYTASSPDQEGCFSSILEIETCGEIGRRCGSSE
jgi:hypothetical protein